MSLRLKPENILHSTVLALLVLLGRPSAGGAAPTELFFSEYVEGTSNNKALEIYNGTGAAVDLVAGGYNVQMFFNGNGSPGLTINLVGTVAAGDVFVLAQALAHPDILAQADQTNGSGWYNGDDAVVLRRGTTVIDVIGQVGFDPGTEWGSGLVSTADNTLRRKDTVCAGDPNAGDIFDPAPEWDGFATDTFGGLGAHTANCGGPISLSVGDVSQAEGDSGPTTFTFTVSLSGPAGPCGVTFDAATQDGSATVADDDYEPVSLVGLTIPEGQQSLAVDVTVNGDTRPEGNEVFFLDITNVVGAVVTDGQAVGTILEDEVTPIHAIQGSGSASPLVGQVVTTAGIVTARRSNAFFIQTPGDEADADPDTSEGIVVFTGSAPPPTVVVGRRVKVTGTVQEFVPSPDPFSPPITEIGLNPTVAVVSEGNPLPAPAVVTAADTDPAGSIEQLERREGMRVHVDALTVVAPTQGTIDEPNATATSNGVFYGVITGPRPFREPGVQVPDPLPPGAPCCVPRFDANPERVRVDSDGQPGATTLDVATGMLVENLTGVLDYSFRTYSVLPDPATPPTVTGALDATPVPAPAADEYTVASFNMERLFDTVNDPNISDPVLTAEAFQNRLAKLSLAIRDVMRTPDILGVEEAENISVLQALASRISADAVAAGQPDPQYQAYLEEGNDIGGIDVGFLIKSALVGGGVPRVAVSSVTQEGADTPFFNPDHTSSLLNDRPPLVLRGTVNRTDTVAVPLTIIVAHQRSLNDVDSFVRGQNGWPTVGDRVRAKRNEQAEFLADLIQGRQAADPTERIVVVGDFNAFEFSDGYVDVMGATKGAPADPDEVVLPSADLVNPDLVDLAYTVPAAQRYSYSFDGSAQVLDHVLANPPALAQLRALHYARNDADFPEILRNDISRPERISDHDMPVAYFRFLAADLGLTKTAPRATVPSGATFTYTIDVSNLGPDGAAAVVSDTLPAGVTFQALSKPRNWSCSTPPVNGSGTVTCSVDEMKPGDTARLLLTVRARCDLRDGTVISNTATVASLTDDPQPANNAATATVIVFTPSTATESPCSVRRR
jgi:uncharacterized protein